MTEAEHVCVQVLYDFNYITDDGRTVWMREGEEFLLLSQTNEDWWQVIRDGEQRPFYAPANYVQAMVISPKVSISDDDQPATTSAAQTNGSCEETAKFFSTVQHKRDGDITPPLLPLEENGANHVPAFGLSFSNPLCAAEDEKHINSCDEYFVSRKEDELSNIHDGDDDINSIESTDFFSASNEEQNLNRRGDLSPAMSSSIPTYANLPCLTTALPPMPSSDVTPLRTLMDHWSEYIDSNGRKYYYNSFTREASWKPPRRSNTNNTSRDEGNTQSEESLDDPLDSAESKSCTVKNESKQDKMSATEGNYDCVNLSAAMTSQFGEGVYGSETLIPLGYDVEYDVALAEEYFVNSITKKKWFRKVDDCGRCYFFEENATESFWELPKINMTQVIESEEDSGTNISNGDCKKQGSVPEFANPLPLSARSSQGQRSSDRATKAYSMVMLETVCLSDGSEVTSKSNSLPRGIGAPQWSLLQEGGLVVSRQGMLNKTKCVESGRKLRKNWSQSFVVLTDHFLLIYKDMKSAQMQGPQITKPEICVDLAGAFIEWCPDKSSKKNVFQITTVLRQEILLQDDNAQTSKEWFEAIQSAIAKLSSRYENSKEDKLENVMCPKEEEVSKSSKLSRSKSAKLYKSNNNSSDDLQTNLAERKRKIRDKLKMFFLRRPSMESLREKGIIKDEPVFGCQLQSLCHREKTTVPKFVQKCIQAIEKSDLSADGLYRASGNLSQVQRIRFQVNQDDYSCLLTEEDVHVLTGALKMFFRDMKEPLFPFKTFNSCLAAVSSRSSRMSKLKELKEVIHSLPQPNYETLKFLLNHLLKVTKHSDQNRMHIQNLAIVFGPTLLWPETESANLAVDMMHQNQVIEFLLLEFDNIF